MSVQALLLALTGGARPAAAGREAAQGFADLLAGMGDPEVAEIAPGPTPDPGEAAVDPLAALVDQSMPGLPPEIREAVLAGLRAVLGGAPVAVTEAGNPDTPRAEVFVAGDLPSDAPRPGLSPLSLTVPVPTGDAARPDAEGAVPNLPVPLRAVVAALPPEMRAVALAHVVTTPRTDAAPVWRPDPSMFQVRPVAAGRAALVSPSVAAPVIEVAGVARSASSPPGEMSAVAPRAVSAQAFVPDGAFSAAPVDAGPRLGEGAPRGSTQPMATQVTGAQMMTAPPAVVAEAQAAPLASAPAAVTILARTQGVEPGPMLEIAAPVEVAAPRAAAPSPLFVAPPAQPSPQLPTHVARQVRSAELTDGKLRIELSPHGIGEMEIEVSRSEGGRLSIVVRAEQAPVLSMIRHDRDLLLQALNARGLEADAADLDFQGFDRGGQGGRGREARGAPTPRPIEADPVEAPRGTATHTGRGALDILT